MVKEHHIVIYKTEYGPFARNRIPKEYWVDSDLVAAFKKCIIIKLVKLKSKEESRNFT